jgi:hypothetical protein
MPSTSIVRHEHSKHEHSMHEHSKHAPQRLWR